MDSISGMLNPIGKMHKTHHKNLFCNGFYWKKLMVHNYILLETVGIHVMVYIGLLFLFFCRVLKEVVLVFLIFLFIYLYFQIFFVLNGYHYVYYLYELN